MFPSRYTSTYNHSYRDGESTISPNAGQPMYHFPGQYDPSHNQRQAGYYGARAVAAETARSQQQQQAYDPNGSSSSLSPARCSANQFDSAAACQSFDPGFTHPSDSASTARAFRTNGFQTTLYGGLHNNLPVNQPSDRAPSFLNTTGTTAPPPAPTNLWKTNVEPHSGSFSNYTTIHVGETIHGVETSLGWGSANNGAGNGGAANSSSNYRYDPSGVAQTKNVDLTRNTDPRNKYMIPGYSGYVRGYQFMHGETFAKTTRVCLDAAIDLPRDPAMF